MAAFSYSSSSSTFTWQNSITEGTSVCSFSALLIKDSKVFSSYLTDKNGASSAYYIFIITLSDGVLEKAMELEAGATRLQIFDMSYQSAYTALQFVGTIDQYTDPLDQSTISYSQEGIFFTKRNVTADYEMGSCE